MDIPGWSPRNHMRQHFEADLPWDTICNISLYISDLLHTHHFLTIKKHSKLSLSKQLNLKPMTPGNPACQCWQDEAGETLFYQESSACSRAEQWDYSEWHVVCLGMGAWTPSWTPAIHAQADTYLWVQTRPLTKEQMQREEVLSSQLQHLEGTPCPASYI